MPAAPTTVKAYLDSLPEDRRAALGAVRDAINKALPKGYAEGMQYGMIGWHVPHAVYPAGYHCDPRQPLPFASIASQKNHMAIYLFCLYNDPAEAERFADAWKAAGKKLDMGKSCVRFKKLEDVPLKVVADAIKRVPVKRFVEVYEANLAAAGVRHPGKKGEPAAKKAAKKPAAKKAGKKAAKKAGAKKPPSKKAPSKKAGARRTR